MGVERPGGGARTRKTSVGEWRGRRCNAAAGGVRLAAYMANIPQTFGDLVRDARVAAELSLRELARRIEATPSYLSDIENNRRVPSEDVLRRIAKALKLDFEDLVVRAGRIGSEAERLARRSPDAARLFRMAPNLGDEQLRKLREQAEKMIRK